MSVLLGICSYLLQCQLCLISRTEPFNSTTIASLFRVCMGNLMTTINNFIQQKVKQIGYILQIFPTQRMTNCIKYQVMTVDKYAEEQPVGWMISN